MAQNGGADTEAVGEMERFEAFGGFRGERIGDHARAGENEQADGAKRGDEGGGGFLPPESQLGFGDPGEERGGVGERELLQFI
jgi:hypothetical protein